MKRTLIASAVIACSVLMGTSSAMAEDLDLVFECDKTEGFVSWFYTIFLALQVGAAGLMFPFVFPLLSRYENTVKNTFINSFLLAIGFLPSWIKFTVAWIGPIAISYIYPIIFTQTWWMWLVFLFGLIAWGTSFTIRAVFRGNKKVSEEKAAEENNEE